MAQWADKTLGLRDEMPAGADGAVRRRPKLVGPEGRLSFIGEAAGLSTEVLAEFRMKPDKLVDRPEAREGTRLGSSEVGTKTGHARGRGLGTYLARR